MTTKLTNSIRKFHRDEEGLEALQVVMIIAIAAMVMIACATVGKAAVTWMKKLGQAQGKTSPAAVADRRRLAGTGL